jgi:hypothetical protein
VGALLYLKYLHVNKIPTMYYSFQNLYNTETPTAINSLCELIMDTYNGLVEKDIEPQWTKETKYFNELGFNLYSADKSQWIFCGLCFDLWETKSIPFCIMHDWKKNSDKFYSNNLKTFVGKLNAKSISFLLFNDYPCMLFQKEYFDKMDNHTEVISILSKLNDELKLGLYFNK